MDVKAFNNLRRIRNVTERQARFIALLSLEVLKRSGVRPIVVGGMALELYTSGQYQTGDIDIKSPASVKEILAELGFKKAGRTYYNKDLDIFVDWLGSGLSEGPEAEAKTYLIGLDENKKHVVRVVSREDLIIDRLNAAKWWEDVDSCMWARLLVKMSAMSGEPLDIEYLKQRAKKDDVADFLDKILNDEPIIIKNRENRCDNGKSL